MAVEELLGRYRRAREQARRGGLIVSVEVADPILAPHDGRRTLHGLRPLVLFALDDHVARRLAALRRRVHGDAFETGSADEELLRACDHLEGSLAPVPYRRLLAFLVLAVPAIALGMIQLLRGDGRTNQSLGGVLNDASRLVGDLAERLLTLDIADVPTVLNDIADSRLRTIVFVVMIVLISMYLALRPFVGSLRVKRALLSGPGGDDYRTAAGGAYSLETRVLGPAARELPLDLAILALPMFLPLYVGLYMMADALTGGGEPYAFVASLIAAGVPAARLAFLAVTAQRRAARARGWQAPAAATVRQGSPAQR